jgi:hypothetical protein
MKIKYLIFFKAATSPKYKIEEIPFHLKIAGKLKKAFD